MIDENISKIAETLSKEEFKLNNDERIINALERIATSLEIIAHNKTHNTKLKNNANPISSNNVFNSINNDSQYIENFLMKKGVTIKFVPEINSEINDVLYSLASFMGNNYSKISSVYKAIKSRLSSGESVKIDMKNFTQEEISYSCQFCHNLYELTFLDYYKYLKSPKYQIILAPNRIPLVINFLTGHWLESYVVYEIKKLINYFNIKKEVSFLLNPQICLPNGDDFELDILFSVDDNIYWIESKTSDYHHYVEKYSKVAKILNSENLHPYLLLTDIPQQTCNKLTNLFGIKVLNIENFSEFLFRELEQYKTHIIPEEAYNVENNENE